MKFRSKLWWILPLLAVAGGVSWYARKPAVPAPMNTPAATAVPAAVIELKASNLLQAEPQMLVQTLAVSGNLKAINTVAVKARVAGELIELTGREGDSVRAGQVIARIDPTEYQRRLRQAEQQADAAKTQIDIAQRQYDNNKALVDQGFISKTALEAFVICLHGVSLD